MGSIVYDACLKDNKPDEEVVRVELRHLFDPFVIPCGGDTKIGTVLRIKMPSDYKTTDGPGISLHDAIEATKEHEAIFGRPSDPEPVSFMVYHPGTDEMVPLTQSRLDDLVSRERAYFQMIKAVRPFVAVNDLFHYGDTKAYESRLEDE
jgi:hypothetical protein